MTTIRAGDFRFTRNRYESVKRDKEIRLLYDERGIPEVYGKQNNVIMFGFRTEQFKAWRGRIPIVCNRAATQKCDAL